MLREPPQRSIPARTGPRGLTGWHDVCRLNEIRPGRARPVLFNGTEIAIFRDEDDVYALGGTCPHRGGPLGSGTVAAGRAVCSLHGREYDLRTGISPHDPRNSVPTYRCRVVAGTVQLDADSVPAGPGRPDGYLGRWARRGADDHGMALIQHLASGGPAATAPESAAPASERTPTWSDLALRPAPLTRPPLDPATAIDVTTVLGTGAARPLALRMPLLVATSTAVSPESRLALARGAAEAGTVVGTGGGIVGREQGAAGAYLLQLQPGVPVRDADLLRADAVELSISADPRGRPGFRDATDHANVVLTTPVGHAPSVDGIPDYATELLACVEALRDRTGGAPIGLRIAAGSLDTDVATAAGLGIDFLTVTAGKGVGLPVLAAIVQARRLLAAFPRVQLVVAGGLRTPDEIVKALALGADAITLGSAALMAMGCQRYRACDQGTCPVGIATQQAELRLRFNADISAHLLATFLTGTSDGIAAACRLAGRRSIADLRPDDLVALTPDTATITGLPYLG